MHFHVGPGVSGFTVELDHAAILTLPTFDLKDRLKAWVFPIPRL